MDYLDIVDEIARPYMEKKTAEEYREKRFKEKYKFTPDKPGSKQGYITVNGRKVRCDIDVKSLTMEVDIDANTKKALEAAGINLTNGKLPLARTTSAELSSSEPSIHLSKTAFKVRPKRLDPLIQHEMGHIEMHNPSTARGKYNTKVTLKGFLERIEKQGNATPQMIKDYLNTIEDPKEREEQRKQIYEQLRKIKRINLGGDKEAMKKVDEVTKNTDKHRDTDSERRKLKKEYENSKTRDKTNAHDDFSEKEADRYAANRTSEKQLKRGLREYTKKARGEFEDQYRVAAKENEWMGDEIMATRKKQAKASVKVAKKELESRNRSLKDEKMRKAKAYKEESEEALEKDEASVGAMLPITEPDQILSKSSTEKSKEKIEGFNEGVNLEINHTFRKNWSLYKSEMKEAKRLQKQKDYQQAAAAAQRALELMHDTIKEVSSVESSVLEAFVGGVSDFFGVGAVVDLKHVKDDKGPKNAYKGRVLSACKHYVNESGKFKERCLKLAKEQKEKATPTTESVAEEYAAIRLDEPVEPFEEGTNLNMVSLYNDARDNYKKEIKEAKDAFKKRDYKNAELHAKLASEIMVKARDLISCVKGPMSHENIGSIFLCIADLAKYVLAAIPTFGIGGFVLLFNDIIKDSKAARTKLKIRKEHDPFAVDNNEFQTRLVRYTMHFAEVADRIAESSQMMANSAAQTDPKIAKMLALHESVEELSRASGMNWFDSFLESASIEDGNNIFIEQAYEELSDGEAFLEEGEEAFEEAADIDADIQPVIKQLNQKGYKTKYSCSGHPSMRKKGDVYEDGIKDGKLYSTARIVFAEIYDFPSIPKYWKKKVLEGEKTAIYVKAPTFNIVKGIPEHQYKNWKARYMDNLRKWADDLPDKKETKKDPNASVSIQESAEDAFYNMIGDLMIETL